MKNGVFCFFNSSPEKKGEFRRVEWLVGLIWCGLIWFVWFVCMVWLCLVGSLYFCSVAICASESDISHGKQTTQGDLSYSGFKVDGTIPKRWFNMDPHLKSAIYSETTVRLFAMRKGRTRGSL